FNNCSGLTSATISEGVTLIRQEAFSDCYGLTSVTIPSSVTSIGNYAFQNCNVLTSVTWAATNVTSVSSSSHPFNGCTNLTSVTFSEDVTSIPAYAFYNVKSLTSVTIPSSVTSIGNQAFYDTAIWNNHPDGIVYIDGWAIDWKGTGPSGQLALNPGTRGIADRAFYNCSGLTGVTIPSGVTSIGQQAFQGCSGLTGNLTIPSGVTSIGSGAFYGCSGLTGVTIPSSVTSIGNQAFYDTAIWNNHPDDIVYIDGWAIGWKGTQPSGWLTLNPGTRGIADRGVSGCGGLTSVTIPSSVTSIGASAFSGCSKLTSVYFMGNAPSVVGKWIYDSSSISLTTYVLPYSTGWDGVAGSTALPALWNDRNIVCLAPVLDDVLKITDLPWEIGGDGDWLVQMVSTDSHVIRSGTIGDRESSWIETSVTGSGMFSFWWKVSSEIDDWLICTTNGVEALRISGEADWQQVSWMFGGGETVVRWTYAKDKSGVAGEDCGWLDGVAWIPYITVSFDAQGGSGVSPVDYDTKNAVYGELPETSRGGYGFEGWFASPSGGVAVTGSTPVGESSHTLYAQWSLLAPGGVTASQGTLRDKVLVGWSPVASAVSYSVYRSTGDDPAGAVCVDTVAGGTSYEDFGAEREVSYFYWVTSFDGSEESAFSAVAHGWREPLGLAEAVNGEGLAWTTGGDLPWLPQRDVTHDNEHAARSGAIEHSGMAGFYTTSWIETTVTGEGTLSFWWKVSSEEDYDWLSCFTNGVLALRISGEQDWAQVSIAITSEGETTVRWEYAKDKSDFEGQDCAWLDGVVWTPVPLYTSTPVPVPYSWLDQWQGGLVGSQAYEDFANSIGANGYTVWESYVAGLDPTDKDSIFRIRKFAVKNVNGTDTVTVLEWNPNYENDPPPLKRDYIIEGKTNLTDTAWHSPTNSGTRFFRVKAKLP
ncbi:MAG: leucine-rich repeat protein, partial [Kiritimatiellaeota bacterium]|nr:leucine-rich repeat protein [Kiritimatiellota bacterium]